MKPPTTTRSWGARLKSLHDGRLLHAWAEACRRRGGAIAYLARQVQVFFFTARTINDGEITRRAAALTYHTLLAIVPLLAVAFALFKAFGGLQRLEAPLRRLILENLAVGRAEEVGRWLNQFTANISAGAIAGVGTLLLFYSAISLLVNSEQAFNRIWGISRGRPLHLRLAVYWFMITVGPILVGVSLSISAQLQRSAFTAAALGWLPWGLGRWLLSLSSTLAVCALFVAAYALVPNTKVRLRSALAGGLVAGLLWTAVKALFVWLSASVLSQSAVYGALGALPLLMLWLYYSWVIVLFGVSYTYASQSVATDQLRAAPRLLNQAVREALALRLLADTASAFQRGAPAPTAAELAARAGAPPTLAQPALDLLLKAGLLAASAEGDEPRYLPARAPDTTTVAQVFELLRHHDGEELALVDDALQARVGVVIAAAEAARCAQATTTLAALGDPQHAAPPR
ncbi:MAG: YihY family inner membrane protein [Proteobacteria bacterium]|nr:YihY family inner membrane protein [Pseudomonadota bacterium]